MSFSEPRGGLIIVRTWLEPGTEGVRVRVTEIDDVRHPEERVRASGDAEEIGAWVRAFVTRFGMMPS